MAIRALGEELTKKTEIAVRPASTTLQKLSGSGAIVGGQTQAINIPQSDFMAGSFKYDLVVSRSPVAQVADQLRYLVTYPYGCTEQTVSAAFPQLYYGDMVDALKLNPANKQNAAYNVSEAIRTIKCGSCTTARDALGQRRRESRLVDDHLCRTLFIGGTQGGL